jgi:hypothetical protein
MGALFQDGLADWTVGRNITLTIRLEAGTNTSTGLDTKTYWLTDRQWQCDFDLESSLNAVKRSDLVCEWVS